MSMNEHESRGDCTPVAHANSRPRHFMDERPVGRSATVGKSILSSVPTHQTIAREALLMRFQPLRRARCVGTGNAAVEPLCILGRCFAVVNAQADARGIVKPGASTERTYLELGQAGDQYQPPPQSTVVLRAGVDAANGRMSSPHPRKRWRFVRPGASGVAIATATNRHCRPTRDWPTFNGRLEMECGRSAGGSPPAFRGWPKGPNREPRVSLSSEIEKHPPCRRFGGRIEMTNGFTPPEQMPPRYHDKPADELKPCPFCGGQPRLVDLAGWEIECDCGVNVWGVDASKEAVVEHWNRRIESPVVVTVPIASGDTHPLYQWPEGSVG